MPDQLTDFLLPERGVRGAIVEINDGIADMLGWRAYPPDVRRLLGHAIAAMPLLASHSKFEGRINLQFQGKGALKLLVAQIDRDLRVRGMAKAPADAAGDFESLMGGGLLALVLEPDKGAQNYQAMVEIRGSGLAAALEGYFAQSEQLPTLIRLAGADSRLSGILLQRLPARAGRDDDANWQHVGALFATLGEAELAATEPPTLLRHLFHEDEVRVFEPRALRLSCSCSHASISGMLLSLGAQQLEPVLKEHGKIEVGCEFCGRTYTYTRGEVEGLFKAAAADDDNVRH
ncbi:MAG: Hsp33 family molecular chaperone HslO [Gammaproteobacteria bacterium]|nr:Hsp33 family molecular chaperone HslO [Gammaproteobacteria bacterium]